ncbi:MAG: hypothetical protein M3164_07010 [Actinomycetota bacterium]|nr:hypothetical protein [Actinomycetota bacterium]
MIGLSWRDLNASIRAAAHLVPGNRNVTSPPGRWLLGASTHMSISILFAVAYFCLIRRAAFAYGIVLWLVNTRVIAPAAFREEDRSFALADHLCWAAILHVMQRLLDGDCKSESPVVPVWRRAGSVAGG